MKPTTRQPIRKAAAPIAGPGPRVLPATEVMSKELLPIVDKPIIQCGAEEAVAAGGTGLIYVTRRTKRAIEDHFDVNPEPAVERLVEKPAPGTELSPLPSIGHYVPDREILGILKAQPLGHGSEIQLADAANTCAGQGHVHSLTLKSQRYDCGAEMGNLEAVVGFALEHPGYADRFGALVDNKAAARRARAAQ